MARSRLDSYKEDLISDSGNVLFSFVIGEQLEYPVVLSFVNDVTAGYEYEAVVVEALNVPEQTSPPKAIRPNGVQTVLDVRVPVYRGDWNVMSSYNTEDIVTYNDLAYKLKSGAAYSSMNSPPADPAWEPASLQTLYIQFPATLGATWQQIPVVGEPVYGFFELRVTEPNNSILRRTWKPVRGIIELLFSPTHIVP
jgi:hypothetical protein